MPRFPLVLTSVAAVGVAGGVIALLLLLALRRLDRIPAGAEVLLRQIPDALGDAALLLDAAGRVRASSAVAAERFGRDALRGAHIETLLGEQAAMLRKGLSRGPASGRLQLAGGGWSDAALVRVRTRPVRDLLVLRFERSLVPPPLPGSVAAPPSRARAEARADLAAIGVALHRPVQQAATAAGLLRLVLPAATIPRELERLEAALEEAERRTRILQASGEGPRHVIAVDLAALVRGLVAGLTAGRLQVRTHLAPAHAWIDGARVRMALREIVQTAAGALPKGSELLVRVGMRSGTAFVEIGLASAEGWAVEVSALGLALLAPEGGAVELEEVPGHGGLCRISLPTVAGEEKAREPRVGTARPQPAQPQPATPH